MKQIKLLIAVLAVVFSSAGAFTLHPKFNQSTFSYISGALTNPSSYIKVDFHCTGNDHFSQVYVLEGPNDQPDNDALQALYTTSSHFSFPGTFSNGRVYFCVHY